MIASQKLKHLCSRQQLPVPLNTELYTGTTGPVAVLCVRRSILKHSVLWRPNCEFSVRAVMLLTSDAAAVRVERLLSDAAATHVRVGKSCCVLHHGDCDSSRVMHFKFCYALRTQCTCFLCSFSISLLHFLTPAA